MGAVSASFEAQPRVADFDHIEIEDRPRVARAVLEAALDAIIVIDSNGLVVEWNPAASELFGYTRADVIGGSIAELIIPEELREGHRSGLEKYLATGEGPVLNTRVKVPGQRADGSRFTAELSISPSEGPDGPMFTGWLRDITELEEAREAAKRSEERLSALIANISDVITVLEPDGTWVSSSDAGGRMLGYEPGYDPEGGIFSLLHPADAGPAQEALQDLLAGRRSPEQRLDLRVRSVDGEYHVFETVAEDRTGDPSIGGVVLSSRDVTQERADRARLRETKTRLEALVGSLSDAVLFLDDGDRVAVANRAFSETFGMVGPPAELVGLSVVELSDRVSSGVYDDSEFWRKLVNHGGLRPNDGVAELELIDGRTLELDHNSVAMGDEAFGQLWLFRDITQRKTVEETRERLLIAEREAKETAEQTSEELRQLAELKSEIVAMVSHELRTPLTSIVSFTELLRSDVEADIGPEQLDFLEVVDRNAKRLVRLVDDLLLLGQLESGVASVSWEEFPVGGLLKTLVAESQLAAEAASVTIRLSIDDGPPLRGDEGRLYQVLQNLLSNALKLAPDVTLVEVTAERAARAWVFSVTDDGPGIALDDQDQLFEKFFRVPGTDSSSGTGLGLAISRSLVELHDGTIQVHSALGQGATFQFAIPDRVREP